MANHTDAVTGEAAGTQVGITKFTDLGENFYQTAVTSAIDQLPVGSLIWNDAALAAFSSKSDLAGVAKQKLLVLQVLFLISSFKAKEVIFLIHIHYHRTILTHSTRVTVL